uniref:(northern house mosquito) hypothetical protein n=1 Tax=Culex pipiens TaxID=7175 RepID=A0A8D8DZC9_CULPI
MHIEWYLSTEAGLRKMHILINYPLRLVHRLRSRHQYISAEIGSAHNKSAVKDLCYGDRRDQQRNWYSLRRRFVAVSTTHFEAQDNNRAGRSTHRDRRAHET